jgi:hypothetical protein
MLLFAVACCGVSVLAPLGLRTAQPSAVRPYTRSRGGGFAAALDAIYLLPKKFLQLSSCSFTIK